MQFYSPNYQRKCSNCTKTTNQSPKNFEQAKKAKETLKQGYVWLTCKISKNAKKEIGWKENFERKTAEGKHLYRIIK